MLQCVISITATQSNRVIPSAYFKRNKLLDYGGSSVNVVDLAPPHERVTNFNGAYMESNQKFGVKFNTPWGEATTIPADSMISGARIFYIMDSCGMPFDILREELKDKGLVLDTVGFMEAALKSKNYKIKRLKMVMCVQSDMPESLFDHCIEYLRKNERLPPG